MEKVGCGVRYGNAFLRWPIARVLLTCVKCSRQDAVDEVLEECDERMRFETAGVVRVNESQCFFIGGRMEVEYRVQWAA